MRRMTLAMIICLTALTTRAGAERAGEFDYFVMALSWSANWCALEGDARHSPSYAGKWVMA